MMEECIERLESKVFPDLAQQWRTETENNVEMIPQRLPLKRRLAEFRYNRRSIPGGFRGNCWAIERFRDLSPIFVLAVFEGWLVLEPGDVGPLPFSHPVARELIWAVNEQTVTPRMLALVLEAGSPLYDGCVVIGIVDYRRWAFGSLAPTGNNTSNSAPEMHKILLKPTYESFFRDLSLSPQDEAELLKAVSGPLCLDPDPAVCQLLTWLNYDVKKFSLHLKANKPPAPSADSWNGAVDHVQQALIRSPRLERFVSKLMGRRHCGGAAQVPQMHQPHRFRLLGIVESAASNTITGQGIVGSIAHRLSLREPMYGLDARKDPARLGLSASPSINWLPPNSTLWRTMRFETTGQGDDMKLIPQTAIVHYTLHIMIVNQPSRGLRFEGILRIGSQACLGDLFALTFNLPGRLAVESYVEQLKVTMMREGKACVADVSNPNALASLRPPVLTQSTSLNNMSQAGHSSASPLNKGPPYASPMVNRPPMIIGLGNVMPPFGNMPQLSHLMAAGQPSAHQISTPSQNQLINRPPQTKILKRPPQ